MRVSIYQANTAKFSSQISNQIGCEGKNPQKVTERRRMRQRIMCRCFLPGLRSETHHVPALMRPLEAVDERERERERESLVWKCVRKFGVELRRCSIGPTIKQFLPTLQFLPPQTNPPPKKTHTHTHTTSMCKLRPFPIWLVTMLFGLTHIFKKPLSK